MRPLSRCGVSTPLHPQPLPASVAVGLEVMLGTTGLLRCPLASVQGCGGLALGRGTKGGGGLGEGVALSTCFPVPPTTMGEEENITVIVNQPVTLECLAPGVPPRGSRWLKDGNLLTPKRGVQLPAEGTMLQVTLQRIAENGRGNRAVKTPISPSPPLGESGCRGRGCPSLLPVTQHHSHPSC